MEFNESLAEFVPGPLALAVGKMSNIDGRTANLAGNFRFAISGAL